MQNPSPCGRVQSPRKLYSTTTTRQVNGLVTMIKKLINQPSCCVEEAVEGALLADSCIQRVEGLNILVRSSFSRQNVSIISGGGSGHEPAHAGFIGDGMLTAAVLGNVFASPSVSSILAAIRTVAVPKGVLLIVKNYTGDRLNFGMAAEMAKQEGIKVEMVIVADDCALPLGKGITGGRGLAGTIFVHKIAGACAATGASLAEVYAAASTAALRVGTLGVALSTCTVPGTPASDRLSKPGLIEVGMGIHGEPGREQVVLPEEGAADFVAERLVAGILDQPASMDDPTLIPKRLPYTEGQRVAVLVNNLGALPVIELQIVTRGVMLALRRRGLVPVRALVGAFMTSLEMAGVSLSLLMLPDSDYRLLDAIDQETTAPAWVRPSCIEYRMEQFAADSVIPYDPAAHSTAKGPRVGQGLTAEGETVTSAIRRVCHGVIAAEAQLTSYDAICGDGDCGVVMRRGVDCVLQSLPELQAASTADSTTDRMDLAVLCNRLAEALSGSMGGTSGVLLELGLRAMATAFQGPASADDGPAPAAEAGAAEWAAAFNAAVTAVGYYGGASSGMRTMLDALIPAATVLKNGGTLDDAAKAAKEGALATADMDSLAGRSNYVSPEHLRGTPDPGAYAISVMFAALVEPTL